MSLNVKNTLYNKKVMYLFGYIKNIMYLCNVIINKSINQKN